MMSLWMRLLGWRSSVANTTGGCRRLDVRGATETPSNTSMTRSPPAGRLSSQGRTGRLTLTAAYQCPQQIGIDLIVTRGALLVPHQFGLDLIKIRLAHQGRDGRDEGPILRRGRVSARSGFAHGMGGRASHPSRAQSLSTDVDVARIRGIGKQAPNRGATPALLTTR